MIEHGGEPLPTCWARWCRDQCQAFLKQGMPLAQALQMANLDARARHRISRMLGNTVAENVRVIIEFTPEDEAKISIVGDLDKQLRDELEAAA